MTSFVHTQVPFPRRFWKLQQQLSEFYSWPQVHVCQTLTTKGDETLFGIREQGGFFTKEQRVTEGGSIRHGARAVRVLGLFCRPFQPI